MTLYKIKAADMALNLPRYGYPARISFHKYPQSCFYLAFAFPQENVLKKWQNEAKIAKISKIFGNICHGATIESKPCEIPSIDRNSLQECNS